MLITPESLTHRKRFLPVDSITSTLDGKLRKQCQRCSAHFTVYRYRSETARFCSAACASHARRGRAMVDRECRNCGRIFRIRAAQLRCNPNWGIACSRACAGRLRSASFPPPMARFWLNVDRNGPVPNHAPELGNCWIWRLTLERSGYANFAFSHAKHVLAHRYAFAITNGPIPKGMLVMHLCDRRHCVRPEHLRIGTHGDNTADCVTKGRHAHGEKTPISVLTEQDVRAIRSSAEGVWVLAARFGVSATTISHVRRRKTWRHVI